MAILLIAPGEGAEEIVASLAELEGDFELVRAELVADEDGPAVIAAAISGYETQAEALRPDAALVHGSGERPLAAAITLVKLEVPVVRLTGPGGDDDLTGLVAGHEIAPGSELAGQLREWLRRILTP